MYFPPQKYPTHTMKTFAVLLCAIAAAAGAPQGSSATGNAAGNVVTGTTNNGGQTSRITQVSATAGVSAHWMFRSVSMFP